MDTVELLRDAIDQAKKDGDIKRFLREMQGQDEVLLVGVHKVDPPPKNIQLNAN